MYMYMPHYRSLSVYTHTSIYSKLLKQSYQLNFTACYSFDLKKLVISSRQCWLIN